MFDVGFWELAIIAAIALLVIGPERLPKAARTAGLWVGKARRMVRDVKSDIDREIRESDLAELKEAGKELKNVGTSLQSVGKELIEKSELSELKRGSEELVDSVGEELKAAKSEVDSVGEELKAAKSEVGVTEDDVSNLSDQKKNNSDL